MQRLFYYLIYCFPVCFFITPCAHGQSVIEGRVKDRETGEPLAFVNIVYNERGTGTTTGLDGYFIVSTEEPPPFLKFSYVGYEPLIISPVKGDNSRLLMVKMDRKPYLLDEITVKPGSNPAHRIIRQAYRNRRINNPEMLRSFSYNSYNKLFFTLVPDSMLYRVNLPESSGVSIRFDYAGTAGKAPDRPDDNYSVSERPDSGDIRVSKFTESQHLFLMETVSAREYRYPGRNNERVTASRVSGFRDPSFPLLATQIQSFSFYEDFVFILDRKYLSPVSRGSESRYMFILEDSLLTEQNDTLFIISFRPYPNRNFDGLQGLVYINSKGYAVQNIITEPSEPGRLFTIRIRQNYMHIDNRQWFPYELDTDIIFGRESISTRSESNYILLGTGRSYLTDIEIDPVITGRRFNNVELTVSPDAHRKADEYWDNYRTEPLTDKEVRTYHVIDSIGEKAGFDRRLRIFEALASGYIPAGPLFIDYRSLIGYNYFEGFRAGLRVITSERISDRFSLGGYVARGFGDGRFKYGAETGLILSRPADLRMDLSYSRDAEEAGNYRFLDHYTPFSSVNYRQYMIGRMDYSDSYNASLSMRMMRHFKGSFYLTHSDVRSGDEYMFIRNNLATNSFRFTEAGLKLRFAYRERFMETPRGSRISLGTKYPVLWVNIGKGLEIIDGEYNYTRVRAGIMQSYLTRSLGMTAVFIEGGLVFGAVPLQRLYNGNGSYRGFSPEVANSFATMRMGEFVSDGFVSIFFRQNFGNLLFRGGKFRPEFVFVTSAGFSRLSDNPDHLNITLRSMERGFFESGLLINNLFSQFFASYGAGVFYRYGPYSFDRLIDNFAFKFTLNINIR